MSYTPHTDADRAAMLEVIGVPSIDELFCSLPIDARLKQPLSLPSGMDEATLGRHMRELARANTSTDEAISFLGAGVYDHHVPAVVDALASRGEFATAYTPYQPELSQGMLQAIYEFQSLICILTGMDLANASMYDGATAMAEAALMCVDMTGRRRVVVSRTVHPHYRQVLRTYLKAADACYVEIGCGDGRSDLAELHNAIAMETAAVLVQSPNYLGVIEDLHGISGICRDRGVQSVIAVDPHSLALLEPPGAYGFDVVVGEAQSFGCPMGFGGPLLGFFACRQNLIRRFPGRIVGRTHDSEGRRGFTMTLRTREQDIRRERATSNICTNEALLALAATIHLAALGPEGLKGVAHLCLQKAHYAAGLLGAIPGIGIPIQHPFFKEFVIRIDTRFAVPDISRALRDRGIIGGFWLGEAYPEYHDCLLVCVTENRSRADIENFAASLADIMAGGL